MRYEIEGAGQANALKIRVDGTEKTRKHEWMYFLHFWCVYWSVGCCINQSIAKAMPQAPGGPPIDYFDNKKLTTPLRTVVQPESLEALNDDIQQERRVRQQHRTEWRKKLNDGISTRRDVRQSLVVGTTTTICTEYNISTISLQQQSINLTCTTTLTTISYQVPRNY